LRRVQNGARYVFGYGSLLWRPGFPHEARVVACLRGMSRRFWQGSPDHRGSPDAPGRVVTLIDDPGAECWGAAYRIAAPRWDEIAARLDARESGGFERVDVELELAGEVPGRARALVYVARAGNPNFLGPASVEAIGAQVRGARGKSGTNVDYVLRLAAALRELGKADEHVFRLVEQVAAGT
jgi:cation transport regulator ChaC